MIWTFVIAAAGPILAAMEQDYGSYSTSKRENPEVEFNWGLALIRWAKGGVWGIATALGIGAVGEAAAPDGAVASLFWPW